VRLLAVATVGETALSATLLRYARRVQPYLKGLTFMLVLGLAGYVFHASDLGSSLNMRWIDARLRGHGVEGALTLIATGGLFVAIGMPRQIVAFLGGYGFGPGWGTLIAASATLAGCVLDFVVARGLLRASVRKRLGARTAQFDRIVACYPFVATLAIRLLPAGNNLATNLLAGVSGIPVGRFLLASFIGYLPQTLIFALIGSGIQVDSRIEFALAAALFGVSGALGVILYRHARRVWASGLDPLTRTAPVPPRAGS
jgi:uncharacterized membrane protein YdjX (TVP38/TMEM64 family)